MKTTILHLIENLEYGGAQTRLLNDLKFINKKEFKNVVCSLYGDGRLASEISAFGVEVHQLKLKSHFDFRGLIKLAGLIRDNRVDIVHTQLFFADIIGRIIGRICAVPYITTTIQSSVYEPDNKYLFSKRRKFFDTYSGRIFNDSFIAVSGYVKESVKGRLKFDDKKIEVINNYVDFHNLNNICDRDIQNLRNELKIKEGETVLVTVGRLNPAKGHRYIFQAFPQILKAHRDVRLLVVGDGPDRGELEKVAKEGGFFEKVNFLGERGQIRELLYLSDIFILLTESEGLSLVILEAMATGRPCVISDILPNREIVQTKVNGLLVDFRNPNETANAINFLIERPEERIDLGLSAKRTVQERYSFAENISKLEDVYRRLLKNKSQ